MSDFIANSTHLGIGTFPVSQRATVVRWTPSASERPDCVSPASVRSATRVSGCKSPPVILATAGTVARRANSASTFSAANHGLDVAPVDFSGQDFGAAGEASAGAKFPSVSAVLSFVQAGHELAAGLASATKDSTLAISTGFHDCHFCSPCLGKPSVACCYSQCNNLYQNSLEISHA